MCRLHLVTVSLAASSPEDTSGRFTFLTAGLLYIKSRVCSKNNYFSTQTYVVGTLKNSINEMVILRTKAYVYTDGLQLLFTILRA